MLSWIKQHIAGIDWILFSAAFSICLFGVVTMNSFSADQHFFERQLIWLCVATVCFLVASMVDWNFLRDTKVVVTLFVIVVSLLLFLFIGGSVFKGARSWFNLGLFAFQPVDPTKLVIIILLAKYFSRRHVEIAHIRHIIVSGLYVFIPFILVFVQPDFGSAIIIFFVWLGMVLVSGISKKHLLVVFFLGVISFSFLWFFVFRPYQKERIINFIHPLYDISGSGYNAYQSMIAVGSGQLLGKGIGYGTQSKLEFLPEYETDFIFAAFAEEWGFVGVLLLFTLYGIVFMRILNIAFRGGTNFETLYGLGIFFLFLVHTVIHVGMNIGILPVTGNTLPFMSYGGSHIMTEFFALGILMSMKSNARTARRDLSTNEMPGLIS